MSTYLARTGFAQAFPRIDAGVVSIVPGKLDGIAANGFDLHVGPAHEGGYQEPVRVRQAAHVFVSAGATGAGTGLAKRIEGKYGLVAVCPVDGQGLGLFVNGKACGAVRIQGGRACNTAEDTINETPRQPDGAGVFERLRTFRTEKKFLKKELSFLCLVHVFKQNLKLRAAPVNSAFHGTHGEARNFCDLFIGKLLNVTENDNFAE